MQPIDTPRVPVSSTYHGETVTEEYRWLEDATSERTQAWTSAQNAQTRAFLEAVPSYRDLWQRAQRIVKARAVGWGGHQGPRRGGSLYFVLQRLPPMQQPFLVALTDVHDVKGATVVVDPNTTDASGATAIDWFVPSPDGRLVAVSLSWGGTEEGTLHVYDVESSASADVEIPRVNTGTMGGSLAWAGDGSGFWYTCAPATGERPSEDSDFFQEIRYHGIGQPLNQDRMDQPGPLADPKIAEHNLDASPGGDWVLDRVQRGDGGEWQVFLRCQSHGRWWMVADIADECVDAVFGGDGALYLLSRAGAPRGKVLKLPLADGATVSDAQCIVPASGVTVEQIAATEHHVWLLDIDGGPSGLRVVTADGTGASDVDVPPVSAVAGLVALSGSEVMYAVESFTRPRVWWRSTDGSAPRPTALADETPFDLSRYEATREVAVSSDGTSVPMTVVAHPGIPRDGTAPCVLYGYGGYGISLKPWFDVTWLLWLEQGGVLAVANVRGGGEYGEEWHAAGRLTEKQHVFDDFAACAAQLVASGVTANRRLALMGGSNGGLLMGAMLAQHPEVARAVVAMVPVMDMLRAELHPNGAFNVTEYGTVQDRRQFEALRAYSPYHNLRDGVPFPATLLTGGENDPRVDASHAKKMAARLQAATSGASPILLRVAGGGHGIGESLDETAAELADVYAFLFDQLGIEYRPVPDCQ